MAIRDRKLSARQSLFVAELPKDFNGTQAVIRAGYSSKGAAVTAINLLRNTKIQSALAQSLKARLDTINIDVEFVLQALKENLFRAMQATPVFDKEGEQTGEYQYQGSVANKALELLGRYLGMFSDKSDAVEDKGKKVVITVQYDD